MNGINEITNKYGFEKYMSFNLNENEREMVFKSILDCYLVSLVHIREPPFQPSSSVPQQAPRTLCIDNIFEQRTLSMQCV